MERLPHPDHDRRTLRRSLAGFLLALLAVPLTALGWWGACAGFVGFLAGVGVIYSARINRCRCPRCGRELARADNTTAFECRACEVVWVTRCYGSTDTG